MCIKTVEMWYKRPALRGSVSVPVPWSNVTMLVNVRTVDSLNEEQLASEGFSIVFLMGWNGIFSNFFTLTLALVL